MSESGGAGGSKLAVMIDGKALPEEEARALWKDFSEHMDVNRGDFAGFARIKGWVSVAPEFQRGKAVLVARTTSVIEKKVGSAGGGGGGKKRRKR